MSDIKLTNSEAKLLQALRAGPMVQSELQDRFPGGYPIQKLLKVGFIVNKEFGYQLTEAGKAACPSRRTTEKAEYIPAAPIKTAKPATPVSTISINAIPTIKQPETIMPAHTNVAKQIRDIITEHPGIEHRSIISKITNDSADESVIRKTNDMIIYVLKAGGFTKIDEFKVGSNEKTKLYYSNEAYAKKVKTVQKKITNTIPTLAQHHEAQTPQPKKDKPMTSNATPTQQTQQPVISIQFAVQLPEMPDKLKLVGLRKSNLDDAIAAGDSYTVDVATLDDNAVDALCAEWVEKFKAHVQARKQQ